MDNRVKQYYENTEKRQLLTEKVYDFARTLDKTAISILRYHNLIEHNNGFKTATLKINYHFYEATYWSDDDKIQIFLNQIIYPHY